MFQRLFTLSPFLLLLVTVASCQTTDVPKPSKSEVLTDHIFGNSGHFRGNSIGDPLDEVVSRDNEYMFKRNQSQLQYSIPFSSSDSAHFDVAYFFENNKLSEIQVEVLLNTEKETIKLFESFHSRLSERYGAPTAQSSFAFWEVRDHGQVLEITLRDESAEFRRPKLSLNIIEQQRFTH